MRNLAGSTTAHVDAYAEDELKEAGIHIFRGKPSRGEVPASVIGEQGRFRFERAWYYWVAHGPVSIELARKMYDDPRGRYDVRVAGHCGCPEPVKPWTEIVEGDECVTEYHIDSQDGLNLFAEIVLGTRPRPPTQDEQKAARNIARANRSGEIIYEDDLIEEDYLVAAHEVSAIRGELSQLRRRLEDMGKGPDKGMGPHSHALSASHGLSLIIYGLYELEDANNHRSFPARAERTKKRWQDLYANPTKYVLREKRD